MQAPRGKQFKINGNVVNVPADVTNTINMLPRLPEQTGTIKVQLKRRLQYKSSALSLNVRPHKVFQAAAWLAHKSVLYREQGITLDQNWANNFGESMIDTDNCQTEPEKILTSKILFKLKQICVILMINGVKMKQRYLQVLLIAC